jgi:glycosyltransferase involved in cell wall biosynthesis
LHLYNVIKELRKVSDFDIYLITRGPLDAQVADQLDGIKCVPLSSISAQQATSLRDRSIRRAARYWGTPMDDMFRLQELQLRHQPDAVVATKPDGYVYLSMLGDCAKIWYPADDPVLHQWSLSRMATGFNRYSNLVHAMMQGYLQFRMKNHIDQAWLVSSLDAQFASKTLRKSSTRIITNGVDCDTFPVLENDGAEHSCVFWGRLDFAPNIDALNWFCSNVWPAIRRNFPNAIFNVIGMCPTASLRDLFAREPSIVLTENPSSISEHVALSQVALFPFVTGAGIKNKVLEAASMGKPIIGSPISRNGLNGQVPFPICNNPKEWVTAISSLWESRQMRMDQGSQNARWVRENHSWAISAKLAAGFLRECISKEI